MSRHNNKKSQQHTVTDYSKNEVNSLNHDLNMLNKKCTLLIFRATIVSQLSVDNNMYMTEKKFVYTQTFGCSKAVYPQYFRFR